MHRTLTPALVLLLTSFASAQPGVKPVTPPQPVQPTAPRWDPLPPHDPLFKRDAAGKVVRINGSLEAMAVAHNPLMDEASLKRMAPVVQEWTADLNQLCIDNVDFMERLDGGMIEKTDQNDISQARTLQTVINHLSSAGPLSGKLVMRGVMDQRQAQMVMQMTNEYVQAVAMEFNANQQLQPGQDSMKLQQQTAQQINKWYQGLPCRDAREQYRRILVDSAPLVGKIMPALGLAADVQAKASSKVEAVNAAKTEADQLVAVRALLDVLTFDQRRAYLAKAVELGAAPDPFHPAPAFPTTGASAAVYAPTPAAAPAAAAPSRDHK